MSSTSISATVTGNEAVKEKPVLRLVSDHPTLNISSPFEYTNFKKFFPCSRKKALRLSFRQLIIFLTALLACIAVDYYFVSLIDEANIREPLQSLMIVTIVGTFVSWVGAYWLVKIRGKCLKYYLKEGAFILSKGALLKKAGSFHLSQITDVYTVQTKLDWLFNVCTLVISTANETSSRFCTIEGMDVDTAHRFQHQLLSLVQLVTVKNDSNVQGAPTAVQGTTKVKKAA